MHASSRNERDSECVVKMFTVIKTLKHLKQQVFNLKTNLCVFFTFDIAEQTLVATVRYITYNTPSVHYQGHDMTMLCSNLHIILFRQFQG